MFIRRKQVSKIREMLRTLDIDDIKVNNFTLRI